MRSGDELREPAVTTGPGPFVERLLDETRNEIDRADGKASVMLGGTGAVAASLIGVLLTADVRADQVTAGVWLLATASAASLALSVAVLVAAVHPRLGRGAPGRARYFVDHAQYRSVEDLAAAVASELDDVVARHLDQLGTLSVIARTKYRLTIVGEWAAAVGLLAAALAALTYLAQ